MKRVRHTALSGLIVAILLHAGIVVLLFTVTPPKPDRSWRRPPVRVKLTTRETPPPKPPEPPKPKPPEPAPTPEPPKPKPPEPKPPEVIEKPKLVKKKVRKRPKKRPPKKAEAPKPPPEKKVEPPKEESSTPPPPAPPVAPKKFEIDMAATVPGGGVAVPATEGGGGSRIGAADGDPDGEGGGRPAPPPPEPSDDDEEERAPLDAAEVTSLPRLLSQPSDAALRAAYPEEARRRGLEADVRLKILVSANGKVARVKVVRGAGNGFDTAAKRLVKKFRFRPAMKGDRPVAVWVLWTYKFRLDG